jgi:hypothetical protein
MRIIQPPDVVFNVRVTLTGQYTYYPSKEVYLFDESIGFGRRAVGDVGDFVARRGYCIPLDRPLHGLGSKTKFATAPNF